MIKEDWYVILTYEQANFENECEFFILDQERQAQVAANAQSFEQIDDKDDNGSSDMLWGAIWCVGGLIATAADVGYIFYGAIIFGGIQFVQGLMKSNS